MNKEELKKVIKWWLVIYGFGIPFVFLATLLEKILNHTPCNLWN